MGIEWTGIAYPFQIKNGSIATSKSEIGSKDGSSEHINQSIELIIKTDVSEWITKVGIGSKFRKFAFSNFSENLNAYIKHTLKKAIEEQDPRVSITDIEIIDDKDQSKVTVRIKWDYNKDYVTTNDDSTYDVEVEVDI